MKGQQKFTRAKTLGWYYEEKQIKKRITDYMFLKTGKLEKKMFTKIIDTDKFKNSFGLERWADIQNMKEAAKVINILSEHKLNSPEQLEDKSMDVFSERMELVADLNKIQIQIDDATDIIRNIRRYKKYKPINDEKVKLNPLMRKNYEKKFAVEIKKFDDTKANLRKYFPGGVVPKERDVSEKKKTLIELRNEKNEQYKAKVVELKELDFARTTLEDYIKNQEKSNVKTKSDLE